VLLTVLSVPGCPNTAVLLERLHAALADGAADLATIVIDDDEQARRWGMTGSPTLLVDGADPFAAAGGDPSVSCRLYRAPDGTVSGAPSITDLHAVFGAVEHNSPAPAQLPIDTVGRGGRGRLAPAEGGLRAVQQAALGCMTESGTPPRPADLDRAAQPHGRSGAPVLRELVEQDFLTVDDSGQLRGIYPYSVTVSRHRIDIADGPRVWAMCAVDALGVAPMTGRDTVIGSTDPITMGSLTFRVSHDERADGPAGAVVLVGHRGCGGPAEQTCCDAINFFGSRHSAARWAALHPDIHGQVLELTDAARLGRKIFGTLLNSG
jgi:hypothetical protein